MGEPVTLAACEPLVGDRARVVIKVNNHTLEFLIDTGATDPMLNQYSGELSQEKVQVQGTEGHPVTLGITIPLLVEVGPHALYHQFATMEGSPINLLGRDLLEKLQAGVMFENKGIALELPEVIDQIMTAEEFQAIPRELKDVHKLSGKKESF